jgi:three-Cys-motif partner protein
MGRASKNKQRDRDTRTIELFELPEVDDSIVRFDTRLQPITSPVWSENKARLIQRYVKYFIMVTHHGTYIDAFAGPQVEAFNDDSWSAKLVLEIEPAWLRRFILCELDTQQIAHLERLMDERKARGDSRSIELHTGNCNVTLPAALTKNPIRPKEATFCLLDQRTFECDWETVRSVATHKAEGNKIELFYFLPVGWLHRSISALKSDDHLRRWWGKDDVTALRAAPGVHDLARLFTDRFHRELHYRSVLAWPIHERGEEGRIMYFMIHAADHEEAPKLMNRAYRKATGAMEPMAHLQLELDSAGFNKEAMDA